MPKAFNTPDFDLGLARVAEAFAQSYVRHFGVRKKKVCPVTYFVASESRYRVRPTISSFFVNPSSNGGISSLFLNSSAVEPARDIGVSVAPGQMALTVMS